MCCLTKVWWLFNNFIDTVQFLFLPSNLFSFSFCPICFQLGFFFKFKSFIVFTTCHLWPAVKFSSNSKILMLETDWINTYYLSLISCSYEYYMRRITSHPLQKRHCKLISHIILQPYLHHDKIIYAPLLYSWWYINSDIYNGV